jgi:hypothetical protein
MQPFEILLYTAPEGRTHIEVYFEEETFWLSQKKIAELFGVDVRTINEHLKNIFKTNELEEKSVIRNFRITAADGKNYLTNFYNLDAIIAVGYRVNSIEATRFRIWSTKTLREFIIKGFVLDDERLKQGKKFGKDYFDELLERIREFGPAKEGSIKKSPTSTLNAVSTTIRYPTSPETSTKPSKINCIGPSLAIQPLN